MLSITKIRKLPFYTRRYIYHLKQRYTKGFDDTETWNLDCAIAKFALPRLKRFKKLNNGHPLGLTWDQWQDKLDGMIYAMEMVIELTNDCTFSCDFDKLNKGLEDFGVHFRESWW